MNLLHKVLVAPANISCHGINASQSLLQTSVVPKQTNLQTHKKRDKVVKKVANGGSQIPQTFSQDFTSHDPTNKNETPWILLLKKLLLMKTTFLKVLKRLPAQQRSVVKIIPRPSSYFEQKKFFKSYTGLSKFEELEKNRQENDEHYTKLLSTTEDYERCRKNKLDD